ncbi:MAG: DUF3604 domain-containing protein [Acetobacteraceae bacterium]
MPFTTYRADEMGSVSLSPGGPFEAGSHASLRLIYTAGRFGIDDTGHLKISWRTTSDMAKPQFDRPEKPNYVTVRASNDAVLQVRFTLANIRPFANTIFIRLARGFLRQGDRIIVVFGERSRGSPGYRLQTNREAGFPLKVSVDAFATYEFCELDSPAITLIAGPASGWRAVLPTLGVLGEPFRLAMIAEDRWGNPTEQAAGSLFLAPSRPVSGLPGEVVPVSGCAVIEGLSVGTPGDLRISATDSGGREICTANPMRVVERAALRHYWADLHGQSGETIGAGTAEAYFRYARDAAFIDIAGHQGNDFQISDSFWAELNRLTEQFNVAGRFLAIPGYEWSGNTGMGGDRNVFFATAGRAIRHSSRILLEDRGGAPDCFTAAELFRALADEDAVVIAHVGGRYADIRAAHDGRLERAVEVHSTWGTFEWLLHDAFDCGYRVGVVCHSDDHKGRPGATRPGASHFGAIGGLTCYLMEELTRPALFRALRRRHHYGTTGARLFLAVEGHFSEPVTLFDDDPAFGPTAYGPAPDVMMGDIAAPGSVPMQLRVAAAGSAPLERIEVFHGKECVRTVRPFGAHDLGRRVRVLWEGAEYRGRGREVVWEGTISLSGVRFHRAEAVNFLNPESPLEVVHAGSELRFRSVTTGNRAGVDLWLESDTGTIAFDTNVASCRFAVSSIGLEDTVLEAGGLGRRVRLYRLPEHAGRHEITFTHEVRFAGPKDLPVYVRLVQEDGNLAWSSPIYLIAP